MQEVIDNVMYLLILGIIALIVESDINEIAQGIADVTIELMNDSVSWQLSHIDEDGDDYDAIHADILFLAIAKMYKSLQDK